MAQAIRKADETGLEALRFLTYTASPVSATLAPAGLQTLGRDRLRMTTARIPQDPTWKPTMPL